MSRFGHGTTVSLLCIVYIPIRVGPDQWKDDWSTITSSYDNSELPNRSCTVMPNMVRFCVFIDQQNGALLVPGCPIAISAHPAEHRCDDAIPPEPSV